MKLQNLLLVSLLTLAPVLVVNNTCVEAAAADKDVTSNITNTQQFTAIEYCAKGNEALFNNDLSLAIDNYTKAIELDPKYEIAYANRSAAYICLRKYELALDDCNKGIQLDPNDFVLYDNRSSAYIHLQKYDQAIDDCNKALQLNPNSSSAYNNRGAAYEMLEKYEQAITNYKKAIELDPNKETPREGLKRIADKLNKK